MMANNEDIMDVYTRFKEKGFPYYSTDKKWRDEKFNILTSTKLESIIAVSYTHLTLPTKA